MILSSLPTTTISQTVGEELSSSYPADVKLHRGNGPARVDVWPAEVNDLQGATFTNPFVKETSQKGKQPNAVFRGFWIGYFINPPDNG